MHMHMADANGVYMCLHVEMQVQMQMAYTCVDAYAVYICLHLQMHVALYLLSCVLVSVSIYTCSIYS